MAALPPNDRRKLVGVLGMLGSDAAGERAAAALLATKMIKAAGLQWSDLIGPAPQQQRHQHQHQARPQPGPQHGGDLAYCLRHLATLNTWEAGFVTSLSRRPRQSIKQMETLRGIAADLRRRGFA